VKDLPHGARKRKEADGSPLWVRDARGAPVRGKNGNNVQAMDPFGAKRTRVMYAAQAGDVARLQWLIARGARLELKDWAGRTAMWWASRAGRVETVRELLACDAAVDTANNFGKTPVHIASSQGRGAYAFGALVRYHMFDYERLAKLRGTHLRDAIAHCRREAGLASQESRTDDRLLWQSRLEESELLDQRLQWLQEGAIGHPAPGDCRIRTPWKTEADQPQGWRPDLDDGVVVNIAPLQVAGVLRTETK
jgi:hypothetical protein